MYRYVAMSLEHGHSTIKDNDEIQYAYNFVLSYTSVNSPIIAAIWSI